MGIGIRVVSEGQGPSRCDQETDESCNEAREESVPDVRRHHTNPACYSSAMQWESTLVELATDMHDFKMVDGKVHGAHHTTQLY